MRSALASKTLLPGFRPVPKTGVIYVMTEAAKLGFNEERDQWSNLGQGAPETGPLENSPERINHLDFSSDDHEYAPVAGLGELRDAVANLYNVRFRQGKTSKYTRENVAIASGGRLALTRLVSTIGKANIGHFLPDYTAYEELLGSFSSFVPIPILADTGSGFRLSSDEIHREILGRGLSAALLSNPCNPTGQLIHGSQLEAWVNSARELQCALIFDEFYSHYVYHSEEKAVSAAEFVEDVNQDPIIFFDGLTKNWRYPGFRVSWTVGPSSVIEAVSSAGSFIDGGCARPMQLAALPLLDPKIAEQEAASIRHVFREKRDFMLSRLKDLGIVVSPTPQGGFYCWGDLSALPESINTGMKLFRKALEQKVVIVPGVFFDINPGQRRPDRASRFGSFARFSFGPPRTEIERGLAALEQLIRSES